MHLWIAFLAATSCFCFGSSAPQDFAGMKQLYDNAMPASTSDFENGSLLDSKIVSKGNPKKWHDLTFTTVSIKNAKDGVELYPDYFGIKVSLAEARAKIRDSIEYRTPLAADKTEGVLVSRATYMDEPSGGFMRRFFHLTFKFKKGTLPGGKAALFFYCTGYMEYKFEGSAPKRLGDMVDRAGYVLL